MVSVPLKTTLYDALVMFKQASVHRLSVVDEDAVVTVVSRSRIIQFLANFVCRVELLRTVSSFRVIL